MKKIERTPVQKPNILQVFYSVIAAIFGVQKAVNRTRDFESGHPWPYIIVGVITVIGLLCAIYGIVQFVLAATH